MKTKGFLEAKSLLHFKRWAHTSYAIFNTLQREVRIGFLVAAYFICLGYQSTFARTEMDSINTKIILDEVEVTSRRSPSVYSEVGRVITVLSRAQIEKLPVQSVQELLRYTMSVDVRERGPLGIQADVSMRGGSYDQVMILLNGINITDPQTGHHALNLPIDIKSIERVEILHGPAARIYGPNAFSGAINFVTNTSPSDKISISGMAGEHNLYNLGGSASITTGNLHNYFAANFGESDGYINNTDFSVLNLFYHGRLSITKDHVSLQAGYTEKAFGANSFYTARYPDQFENTRTYFGALSMETGSLIKIRPNLYWRRHHDRFELFRYEDKAEPWYSGHNYHLTDVLGAGVNASMAWVAGTTSVGGEIRSESVWSNVLGHPMDEPIKAPGEKDGYFSRQFHRNNASLFFEHSYTLNDLSVSAGVLMNRNSQSGHLSDLFPGIDLSYWFTNKLKWMAAYNKSLCMPTFTDLFYSGPTNVGNPYLKPEEATTIESGLRWREYWIDTHVSGFYRIGENLIDWGRVPSDEVDENGNPVPNPYTTSNINRVVAKGLEFSSDISLQALMPAQNLLLNLNLNYSYITQDKKADAGYESVYVLDHLRHKLNIGLEHGIGLSGFSMNWNTQYRDREGGYTNSTTLERVSYSPFWITDARLTWRKDIFRVYTEATNLFDKRYSDMGELFQPGRWIKIGFAIDFEI
jgi:vitamin B12 transporter